MESEIQGKAIDNGGWEMVQRLPGQHVIKSKWVFKYKLGPDGSVAAIKARIVACGYNMREGTEYTDVFAATLAASSFRALLAIAARGDLELDSLDAVKAFTQAPVDADIFVEMPRGFQRPGFVMKLVKALEGIKQGAHLWYQHNKKALIQCGFINAEADTCIWTHKTTRIIIGFSADDGLAAFQLADLGQWKRIKAEYAGHIKIGTLDVIAPIVFTGVEIRRDRSAKTITIPQPAFIAKLYER